MIELLVVTTIIGILISLLFPAVQAAREAARSSQCSNNLKQLGLAVLSYENAHQVLPAGAFFGTAAWPTGQLVTLKGSIFVHLLPFIEQQAIYDAYDFKQESIIGQTFPGTTTEIRSTVITTYVCPSDNHPPTFEVPTGEDYQWWLGIGRTVGLHNYAASAGPSSVASNPSCVCALDFNSFATGSWGDPKKLAGPFNRMSICIAVSDVSDGLSNTIFLGEVMPLASFHAERGWEDSCNGSGVISTIIPINFDTSQREPGGDNCHRYCNWNTEWGFKSAHPGGANFVFGDGSVHRIPQTIDHQTYQYLGGKADGHPVAMDF